LCLSKAIKIMQGTVIDRSFFSVAGGLRFGFLKRKPKRKPNKASLSREGDHEVVEGVRISGADAEDRALAAHVPLTTCEFHFFFESQLSTIAKLSQSCYAVDRISVIWEGKYEAVHT